MISKELILTDKVLLETGWQKGIVTKSDLFKDKSTLSSFKKHLTKSILEDNASDSLYFSGENPFLYIRISKDYNPDQVRKLQQKLWNEGRVPLLVIITNYEVKIFDCFDIPVKNTEDLQRNELDKFNKTEEDLKRLVGILSQSKIDSGLIWKEKLGNGIKLQNRVDKQLLKNLSITRKILFNKFKIPLNIIHDLLGRSLFILYLEDRNILRYLINNKFKSFFDSLNSFEETYTLFSNLEIKFNGDLFPISNEEKRLVKDNYRCLELIKSCFYGDDVESKQFSLWRMFQFQYIPIEFISAIYEEFMSGEDDEHSNIKNEGAYYTPMMLVEFMLNKVLPFPDENNKNYNVKIFDPACGSGIFLVESYKRLIARWKYSHNSKVVDKSILENLLLNNIFGIEKDPEAIKIAAFSLYLTFLNYVEPRDILKHVRFFKPLIKWYDNKEKQRHLEKKPGNNLFQCSTFKSNLEIFENKFDLVIGNPPWKRGTGNDDISSYRSKFNKNIPNDIICAYLDFLPDKCPNAQFAIISSAKVLFNSDKKYEKFRNIFFSQNRFDLILNLSVIRDVVFEHAKAPAVVFIFQKKKKEEFQDSITYCVPKSKTIINNTKAIVIDVTDFKYLPLIEILKHNSKIFKIAMWGNVRDLKLIEKIKRIKSIKELSKRTERGGGLHIRENKKPFGNPKLKEHYFITPNKIDTYYISKVGLKKLGADNLLYRKNHGKIFNNPVVIINEGSRDSNICSAFIDFDCVYKSSTYGLSIKEQSNSFHKALTACLNSSLASYFYFMTSGSWGVDRSRVENKEAITFPCLPSSMNEDTIRELSGKVDEIISIKEKFIFGQDKESEINHIQKIIDKTIYNYLNLSNQDRAIIEDALNNSIALKNRYTASCAEKFASFEKDLLPYSETLCNSINSTLNNIDRMLSYQILETNKNNTLNIICLQFGKYRENKINSMDSINQTNFSKILEEINEYVYEKFSESVYYRKTVKYRKNNLLYLIKPNQKKFWSISEALNDADSILLDLLN